jgi:hypothetical protein
MENEDQLVTRGMLEDGMRKQTAEITAAVTAVFNKAIDAAITTAVDGLAGLINKSFIDLEGRMAIMATKDDLRALDVRLTRAIDDLDMHFSAYATRWDRDFENLHGWVEEHEGRLKVLERKRELPA